MRLLLVTVLVIGMVGSAMAAGKCYSCSKVGREDCKVDDSDMSYERCPDSGSCFKRTNKAKDEVLSKGCYFELKDNKLKGVKKDKECKEDGDEYVCYCNGSFCNGSMATGTATAVAATLGFLVAKKLIA